jgi:hypothetical protein
LIFVPGHQVAQKIEPNRVKQEEEGDAEAPQERLFNEYPSERKSNNSGKTILTLLVIFILGFAVWAVWKYAFTKKQETPHITSTEGIVPVKDSAFKADSTTIANSQPVIPGPTDTAQFNIVVNEYHTLFSAEKRLNQLKNYNRNVIMYTTDSITYKVAEPFALPLSDTTRILDSLRRYYTKASVEIK